jgi:hypothetical protein
MSHMSILGDRLYVDYEEILGLRLLGFSADHRLAHLSVDKAGAEQLGKLTQPPYHLVFTMLEQMLRETPPPPPEPPAPKSKEIPKRLRPYLRYTDEQMQTAWAESPLLSDRHYASAGYVRLYLNAAMLREMYRQPARLTAMNAFRKWSTLGKRRPFGPGLAQKAGLNRLLLRRPVMSDDLRVRSLARACSLAGWAACSRGWENRAGERATGCVPPNEWAVHRNKSRADSRRWVVHSYEGAAHSDERRVHPYE